MMDAFMKLNKMLIGKEPIFLIFLIFQTEEEVTYSEVHFKKTKAAQVNLYKLIHLQLCRCVFPISSAMS